MGDGCCADGPMGGDHLSCWSRLYKSPIQRPERLPRCLVGRLPQSAGGGTCVAINTICANVSGARIVQPLSSAVSTAVMCVHLMPPFGAASLHPPALCTIPLTKAAPQRAPNCSRPLSIASSGPLNRIPHTCLPPFPSPTSLTLSPFASLPRLKLLTCLETSLHRSVSVPARFILNTSIPLRTQLSPTLIPSPSPPPSSTSFHDPPPLIKPTINRPPPITLPPCSTT